MNNHLGLLSLCWSIVRVRTPHLTLPAWPFWFCHTFPPPLLLPLKVVLAVQRLARSSETWEQWEECKSFFSTASSSHSLFWDRFYDLRFHADPEVSSLADRCPALAKTARSMKLFTDDLSSGRSSGALVWLNSKSQSYHQQTHHKPPERLTRVVLERKTAWKLKAQYRIV